MENNIQPDDQQEPQLPSTEATVRVDKKRANAIEAYEWVESLMMAFVVILLIFIFLVRNATVFGISMEPTLHEGDRLVLQQIGYSEPQYGDIVVIDRSHMEEDPFVKRVIGKPGDLIYIDFETGEVWRNNDLLDEPYINEPTYNGFDVQFPVKVPEGHLFLMGDNRNHSTDSRQSHVGMVDYKRIMGKAVFRFFPFSKIGGVS